MEDDAIASLTLEEGAEVDIPEGVALINNGIAYAGSALDAVNGQFLAPAVVGSQGRPAAAVVVEDSQIKTNG